MNSLDAINENQQLTENQNQEDKIEEIKKKRLLVTLTDFEPRVAQKVYKSLNESKKTEFSEIMVVKKQIKNVNNKPFIPGVNEQDERSFCTSSFYISKYELIIFCIYFLILIMSCISCFYICKDYKNILLFVIFILRTAYFIRLLYILFTNLADKSPNFTGCSYSICFFLMFLCSILYKLHFYIYMISFNCGTNKI